MGSTFGNLNILAIPGLTPDVLRGKVVGMAALFGYRQTEKKDSSGFSILLFYNKLKKWITIYDERLDEIGSDELINFTGTYSKWLNVSAISSIVFDSDDIVMCLYENGNTDIYVSNTEQSYFDYLKTESECIQGYSEKWVKLLNTTATEADLLALWSNLDYVFAEEKLIEIGKLFGFDKRLSSCGYHYYEDVSIDLDLSGYEVISIHFRKTNIGR